MKEQHLDEAILIRGEINYLIICKTQVENSLWTICKIGASEADHQYASTALNADEDLMRSIARKALLADLVQQIATRRQRLKMIGVVLEGDQPVKDIAALEGPMKEAA